jgi:hypothetical protein
MGTAITVAIDGIVFHGLNAFEARLAGRAFAAEFGRMLERQGLPDILAQNTSTPTLLVDGFQIRLADRPQAIGQQLAKAVYGGLRG